ncbi:hypothetical protein DUI87_12772 [Hirundo rustica rustica]|uniref:Interleukin family protein n=1 Tax=Hirundo rustica rustica TaxID=333673 RepID=A0A3M0KA29_HIRRU|nr:hypothetical protein DUI87_12772 [Hirundo rustica rustica]
MDSLRMLQRVERVERSCFELRPLQVHWKRDIGIPSAIQHGSEKKTLGCLITNCSVRDQLLSFYMKNVFSRLEVGSDKLYFISAFQVLQANMDACLPCPPSTRLTSAVKKLRRMFIKLGDQGIYKAIHELDILLPWIQAYIQTII